MAGAEIVPNITTSGPSKLKHHQNPVQCLMVPIYTYWEMDPHGPPMIPYTMLVMKTWLVGIKIMIRMRRGRRRMCLHNNNTTRARARTIAVTRSRGNPHPKGLAMTRARPMPSPRGKARESPSLNKCKEQHGAMKGRWKTEPRPSFSSVGAQGTRNTTMCTTMCMPLPCKNGHK